MATFNDFVQLELPLRPAILTDPPLETVLVRRGLGPRILEPVVINEGEVLGKVGGLMTSVPLSVQTTKTKQINIPSGQTIVLSSYLMSSSVSRKFIIDISNGTNQISFELLVGVVGSTTNHSIYSITGLLPISIFSITNNPSSYDLVVSNTTPTSYTVNIKEL